jgi:hypothetical protein
MMNSIPQIMTTTSSLTLADRWDHVLARWGYRRGDHRVPPGLYALGAPASNAPVFVTANYTLSFDALRTALRGVDGYILVLDTNGVNVWCAAGKGTFGTEEVVRRVEAAGLRDVVTHRRLILPQLGAPGVAAHEVKRQTGFSVSYGPVRAADLSEYLETGTATPEMREVRFTLWDRLVLIPIELVHVVLPALVAALLLGVLAGPLAAIAAVSAILSGAALFPILFPWLPSRDFSVKGFVLGGAIASIFAVLAWVGSGQAPVAQRLAWILAYLLAMPPVTAYLALNFTGATPFTSRSGVKREMATYIRPMAVLFASGTLLTLGLVLFRWLGV